MAWVLGEYGYLSSSSTKETVIDDLCGLAFQSIDSHTRYTLCLYQKIDFDIFFDIYRAYLVSAIMKLVAQNGSCPPRAAKLIDQYSNSSSLDVYQRCVEFKALLRASAAMVDALPVDASCEDLDVSVS